MDKPKDNHSNKEEKNTRDEKDYVQYRRASNRVKAEVRKAVRDFEKRIATEVKTNPKGFFKYSRSKLKTNPSISDLEQRDGTMATDSAAKAEVLNKFFTSVFTQEDQERLPEFEKRPCSSELTHLHITSDDAKQFFGKLKTSKSPGPDGLHPRVLVELTDQLIEPLKTIFCRPLIEGQLPPDWRYGNITPIFKKGKRHIPGNYRPVSLTSIPCNMLERLVRNAIMEHMESNHLLNDVQHGFVPGRSCSTQLLTVLDDWTSALEDGDNLDALYMDFAKAFDTVPHQRLLVKLKGYGIGGAVLQWIDAFLSGRRQRVVVNGSKSTWAKVTSGIPQGSVLGPLLFVCFINDMPSVVKSPVHLFADDTTLYRRVTTLEDHKALQDDLTNLEDWSTKWNLCFNTNKCKVMHIGHSNPQHDYMMYRGGPPIMLDSITNEKDLGVHVDVKLTFEHHVEIVVNKANRMLGMIRRAYTFLDGPTLTKLYTSLIRPLLEYSNVAWTPVLKRDQLLLENVQRRATKLVPSLKNYSYEDRLRILNLPSLYYRRARGDMIETWKYLHGQYHVNQMPLQRDTNTTTRGHSMKLRKERCLKRERRNFFRHRVVNRWHMLTDNIVTYHP